MARSVKAPRGKLFIISAPSGSGKTTLCKKLLADNMGLVHSVSATTRAPRPGEKDGVDYHFISRKIFETMAERGEFLEYEDNFGELYGTPRRLIKDSLKADKPVLLSIDVKGAMKVRREYPEDSVLIFILPPSIAALEKRLKSRESDGAETIAMRLNLAKKELSYKDKYDYKIVNDKLTGAYRKLEAIIISEVKCVK